LKPGNVDQLSLEVLINIVRISFSSLRHLVSLTRVEVGLRLEGKAGIDVDGP
jgi:hypothetical protein